MTTKYETANFEVRPLKEGELPEGTSDFKRLLQLYNYFKNNGIDISDFEKIICE